MQNRIRSRLVDGIEIAAENGPELTAISGTVAAVDRFLAKLESEDIGVRRLHTSHAFHSAMMEPALEPFRNAAAKLSLKPPQIPYISNVTGTWITPEQATSPDYYAQHLRQAVLFEPGLKLLSRDAGLFLLEVGPGVSLASLAGISLELDRHRIASSLPHPRDDQHDARTMLAAVGAMWATGVPLDWRAIHGGDQPPRRRALPTYPFERRRHWVDPKPGAGFMPMAQDSLLGALAPEPEPELGQYLHISAWTSVPVDTKKAAVFSGTWLVVADNQVFGEKLTVGLEAGGAEALFASIPAAPDGNSASTIAADMSALLSQASGPLNGIIVALGMDPGSNIPGRQRYDTLSAVWQLPEVTLGRPIRIMVTTRGGVPILDESVTDTEASMVFGPVSMMFAESEHLMAQHIDFAHDDDATSDRNARRLLTEAAQEKFEPLVVWRKRRWARRFEPVSLPPLTVPSSSLKEKGVYLITGGLGGIGLTLARWLADTVSARIVLISRNVPPPRAEWGELIASAPEVDRMAGIVKAILEIEAAGGEVSIEPADVTDRTAMSGIIQNTIQKWGEISGVIHAAGVPGNGKLFVLEDAHEATTTLSAKVEGLRVIADLLKETPLDFVALMSSINAVMAVPGNGAYSSANAYLDAFAESLERPSAWQRVLVYNWEAWRDVGMASRIKASALGGVERDRFFARAITPEVGKEIFARLLGSDLDQIVVTPYNLPHIVFEQRANLWKRHTSRFGDEAAGRIFGEGAALPVSDHIKARFQREEERQIAAIWEEVIGAEMEGPHENFFERGGHSLMATRVLSRLNAVAGVKLALRDVFDAPTIGELADRVEQKRQLLFADKDDDREEFVI